MHPRRNNNNNGTNKHALRQKKKRCSQPDENPGSGSQPKDGSNAMRGTSSCCSTSIHAFSSSNSYAASALPRATPNSCFLSIRPMIKMVREKELNSELTEEFRRSVRISATRSRCEFLQKQRQFFFISVRWHAVDNVTNPTLCFMLFSLHTDRELAGLPYVSHL